MSMSDYAEAHLPATTRVGSRRSYSRMSWGSVLAGAAVAGASMILLSLLGVAIGAGGLRFTQTSASDMAGYGLGAGIWTAINLILSMAFGAYVAARLSGTHSHLDGELHGITVWAVATLLVTVLLAQAAGSILGTVGSTAGSAAGTAVTNAGSLAGGVAQGIVQQVSPQGLIDQLDQSLTSSNDPTQMTHAQITGEIATLAGRRVVNGSLTDQDRDRLSALVAAQAGISKRKLRGGWREWSRMLRRHWRKRNSRRPRRQKLQRATQPWVPRQSSQACCSAWPVPWVALGSEPGMRGC
jgi:hypothetical protein